MGDKTVIITKKSGKKFKVTIPEGQRTKIQSTGSGDTVRQFRKRSGEPTGKVESIDEKTTQTAKTVVDLKSGPLKTDTMGDRQATQQKTPAQDRRSQDFAGFYQDEKGRIYGVDREIIPQRETIGGIIEKKGRIAQLSGQEALNTGISSNNKVLGYKGFFAVQTGKVIEASGKATGTIEFGTRALYSGTKSFLRGKTPTRDPATRKDISRQASALSVKLEDVKRNPLTALPAVADTAVKVGGVGTLSKQLEASRFAIKTSKSQGAIITKTKGKQITFVTKEKATLTAVKEQARIGPRIPKSAGGIGSDPVTSKSIGSITTTTRGSATLTDRTFFGSKIAKTTSESVATVKTASGKTVVKDSLVQQSRGISTGQRFAQFTQKFDPFTAKRTGISGTIGTKQSVQQGRFFNVQQKGVGFGTFQKSGFVETAVKKAPAGADRASFGITQGSSFDIPTKSAGLGTRGQVSLAPQRISLFPPKQQVVTQVTPAQILRPTVRTTSILTPQVTTKASAKSAAVLFGPTTTTRQSRVTRIQGPQTVTRTDRLVVGGERLKTDVGRTITPQRILQPTTTIIPVTRTTPTRLTTRTTFVTRTTTTPPPPPTITPPPPKFIPLPVLKPPSFSLSGSDSVTSPFNIKTRKQKRRKTPSIIGQELNIGLDIGKFKLFTGIAARKGRSKKI